MHIKNIEPILIKIGELLNQPINTLSLNKKLSILGSQITNFNEFLPTLSEAASSVNIAFVKQEFEKNEMTVLLSNLSFPIIVFFNDNGQANPLIISEVKSKLVGYAFSHNTVIELKNEELQPKIDKLLSFESLTTGNLNSDNSILFVLSPVELASQFSDDVVDNMRNQREVYTPVRRFFKFLATEKRNIFYIYVYSIIIGIVSLSLPLGIQAIIGLISGGMMFDTVVVLITFVIIGVALTGGLQIIQIYLVEILQRRIFTKAAFEFAFRIPRLKSEALIKNHPPELMNRFFDVLTLQKSFSKILLDLTAAALQIIFGLLLLSFYHNSFVFFGLIMLFILILIFRISGPKGLQTHLKESKYKYKMVGWFEEMARNLLSFKMAGFTNLNIDKTDDILNNYLVARKKHFGVLLSHFINITVFKLVVTAGTLILGCLLVVNKEITLGQFVASEIVIILVLNATEKLIMNVDVVYDVLTAVEKIGQVTDIPLESNNGLNLKVANDAKGLRVEAKNVSYIYPEEKTPSLNKLNLNLEAGEKVVITGLNGSGKNTFVQILSGILNKFSGQVVVEGCSIRNINRDSLHQYISNNIITEEIFEGTLEENIRMGKPDIELTKVVEAIEIAGLHDFANSLENGIFTELLPSGKGLSGSTVKKIIFARNIVKSPKLLIFNDLFQNIDKQERVKILDYLFSDKANHTLIAISNDEHVLRKAERILLFSKGTIVADGNYNDLVNNPEFSMYF